MLRLTFGLRTASHPGCVQGAHKLFGSYFGSAHNRVAHTNSSLGGEKQNLWVEQQKRQPTAKNVLATSTHRCRRRTRCSRRSASRGTTCTRWRPAAVHSSGLDVYGPTTLVSAISHLGSKIRESKLSISRVYRNTKAACLHTARIPIK